MNPHTKLNYKKCSECDKIKHIKHFYNCKIGKYKKQSKCKKCVVIVMRQHRKKNPEYYKKMEKKRRTEQREHRAATHKHSYTKNREYRLKYRKRYYKKNQKRIRELAALRYLKNKDAINLKNNKWRKKNKMHLKNLRYQNSYGISFYDYKIQLKKQSNKCYICNIKKRNLVVDHCHTTGKVRKLLCNNCNLGIGIFKENPKVLRKAAIYVNQF